MVTEARAEEGGSSHGHQSPPAPWGSQTSWWSLEVRNGCRPRPLQQRGARGWGTRGALLKGKGQGGKEGFWIQESSFQQWPHRPHPLQSVASHGGHWGPKPMPLAPRPLSTAGTSARAGLVFPCAQTVRSLRWGGAAPLCLSQHRASAGQGGAGLP